MAEQLHCSEIHSINIENMLSKFYIGSYVLYSSRCNIQSTCKTSCLFIVFNGGHITNYVMCVSGCFQCFDDTSAEGASLSTPSFIIFLPFYKKREDSEG